MPTKGTSPESFPLHVGHCRIADEDVLAHPTRTRILEVLRARGGIHLRELHRRIGGGWGAFAFHLRLLEKAGHIRKRREGAYAIVLLSGRIGDTPVVAHALARAVLDAIPEEGAIELREVIARVGRARAAVAYHVNALARRGLVEKRASPGGRRQLARVSLLLR